MIKRTNKLVVSDSFYNLVAQLGTTKDKRVHGAFGCREISDFELENMYEFDWLTGKVIDIPVDDATRKWRTIATASKADRLHEIRDTEKSLGVKEAFNEAQKWASLYGGAIAVMWIKGNNDVSEPLDLDRIKPGDLESLEVYDRGEVSVRVENMNDITAPYYRRPSHYSIDGAHQIHASRVLRFDGVKLPWRSMARRGYWGASVLQRFYDSLRNSRSVVDSIASMVYEAKLDVISVPDLYQEIASPGGVESIVQRFVLADQVKSFNNTLLLDSKETFQRNATNFAGLGDLMQQYEIQNAAAADIPVTRLFGQSAKGLNATGEGDERNYHNRIERDQESRFSPPLAQFDQVFARSTVGEMPTDWKSTWNPLRQQTEEEIAAIEKTNAERDEKYLQNGVVTEVIVATQLQEDGVYSSIDDEYIEDLKQLELAPEPKPESANADPFGLAALGE
jgi:phage-related protein (TIGR01555 family)